MTGAALLRWGSLPTPDSRIRDIFHLAAKEAHGGVLRLSKRGRKRCVYRSAIFFAWFALVDGAEG